MEKYIYEAIISGLFFLIVAMLAYWLKNNEKRITKLEEEMQKTQKNYLDRFDDLKDTVHKSGERTITQIGGINAGLSEVKTEIKNINHFINKKEKL